MKNNGIKIMNLEGAEILKNNLEGKSIEKDYNCVMDYSLLLRKLYNIELNNNIKLDVNKGTTKDIIMLKFKYGYTPKEVRKLEKELEQLKEESKDNILERKELLEKRKETKGNKNKKPYTTRISNLKIDNESIKSKIKKLKKEIIELRMNKEEAREYLYENGFELDFYKKDKKTKEYKKDKTIKYRYWFRTSAKARVGNVFFIKEELFESINKWQTMGIELPETNAKLVESEAYKSLTASAIENIITIKPSEILVLNDLESHKEQICNLVKTRPSKNKEGNIVYDKDGNEVLECYVDRNLHKLVNVLFDGSALLDDSFFIGDNGMMLLRQHMFKACGFRTYISKFFEEYFGEDYETATVLDRYKNPVAVKNIKMICSENAMKWEKFLGNTKDGWNRWCKAVRDDDCVFGIAKIDHESKYGELQRTSYQQLNSLLINKKQAAELCEETIRFIENMKNDNKVFIDYLKITKSEINENEMIIDLYNRNNNFAESEFFRKYKSKTISEYKETLRAGKILLNGDNLTVVGNPYLMLLHSVGQVSHINNVISDDYEDVTLPKSNDYISCYTERFEEGEELASFRNPHNSFSNIGYNKNFKHNLMKEYFNFSPNIMAINCIKTDEQDRKNSEDFDSDFNYVTNNSIVVDASKKAQEYNTIVNLIEKDKKTYNNTMKDMAKIDNDLAKGKNDIGISSNLAQLALSWYWENPTVKLEEIVATCSVLAQVAIDNAKRKYIIDVNKEVNRIRTLEIMNKEGKTPHFWQYVKDVKLDYKDSKKDTTEEKIIKKTKALKKKKEKQNKIKEKCLEEYICPMDFIQKPLDAIENNYTDKSYINNIEFIKIVNGKANDKQIKKIEELINDLDNLYKEHYSKEENERSDEDEWNVKSSLKTKETIDKIAKIKIKEKTMQILISKALCNNSKNKKYVRKLLKCLYKSHKELFLSVFEK